MTPAACQRALRWLLPCLAVVACQRAPEHGTAGDKPIVEVYAPYPPSSLPPSPPLVRAARRQIGVTVRYDPAYAAMAYPGGDVPSDRGVCTDVIVRALRMQGIDLQREIHLDRIAHRAAYPDRHAAIDRSIDHRRVPNQMAWFRRQGWDRPFTRQAGDYRPGDIVAWKLSGSGLLHIGVVSDRKTSTEVPLVIHNIGSGTQEDDILFRHAIIGHYRPRLPSTAERM